MEMMPIETAPTDGTIVLAWSARDPRIMRFAKFGIPQVYKHSGACWLSPGGTALSNVPTHWSMAPVLPFNA